MTLMLRGFSSKRQRWRTPFPRVHRSSTSSRLRSSLGPTPTG